MELKLKILKATLMLRKCGNKYNTKEEQIAEFTEWFTKDREAELDAWIDSLREELAKTPEQLEEEARKSLEELCELEAEWEYQERMAHRREWDEWDDLWQDRAREVGAVTIWR